MIILLASIEWREAELIFTFTPETKDGLRPRSFNKIMQARFRHNTLDRFPDVHPDRLALVSILLTLPFAEERLKMNWAVSKEFKQSCKVISRISIECLQGDVDPLETISNGIPALSFSGGADSTAALAVMPDSTIPFFMLREKVGKHSTLYRSEAAEKSCSLLKNMGYDVQIVNSDLEFLRNPIGFPVDLAVGTPIILLAEHFKLRSKDKLEKINENRQKIQKLCGFGSFSIVV